MSVLSLEDGALVGYVHASGVPYVVTSTNSGVHAPQSYHYADGTGGVGLAVDFVGPTPSVDSAELAAICAAFAPVVHRLAELIYAGPHGFCVHNGAVVDGLAVYGATVMAAHHNHVHAAVPKGTFLDWSPPMPDPNQAQSPLFAFVPTPTGKGYWMVGRNGEVQAYGDAEFCGHGNFPVA